MGALMPTRRGVATQNLHQQPQNLLRLTHQRGRSLHVLPLGHAVVDLQMMEMMAMIVETPTTKSTEEGVHHATADAVDAAAGRKIPHHLLMAPSAPLGGKKQKTFHALGGPTSATLYNGRI